MYPQGVGRFTHLSFFAQKRLDRIEKKSCIFATSGNYGNSQTVSHLQHENLLLNLQLVLTISPKNCAESLQCLLSIWRRRSGQLDSKTARDNGERRADASTGLSPRKGDENSPLISLVVSPSRLTQCAKQHSPLAEHRLEILSKEIAWSRGYYQYNARKADVIIRCSMCEEC